MRGPKLPAQGLQGHTLHHFGPLRSISEHLGALRSISDQPRWQAGEDSNLDRGIWNPVSFQLDDRPMTTRPTLTPLRPTGIAQIDSYFSLYCLSRARQGLTVPPFHWRYLLHWWGWRCYVLSRLTSRADRAPGRTSCTATAAQARRSTPHATAGAGTSSTSATCTVDQDGDSA